MPCVSVNPLAPSSGKVCGSITFLSQNVGNMFVSESLVPIPAAFMPIAEAISMLAVRYTNPTIILGAVMPCSCSTACRKKPQSIIVTKSLFIYVGIRLMVFPLIYPMNKRKTLALKIFRLGDAFAKFF